MSSAGTACTSCGASINIDPQFGIAECPYCGSIYSEPGVTPAQKKAYALSQKNTTSPQRTDLNNYERQYKKKQRGGIFRLLTISLILVIVLLTVAYLGLVNSTNGDSSTQNAAAENTILANPPSAPANIAANTADLGQSAPINAVATPDSNTETETALAPDVAERSARELVYGYFADWNQPGNLGVAAMLAQYGETANFYGTPTPVSEIARQKWAFAREWPERNYEIRPGTVSASCTGDICVVKGIAVFRVANSQTGRVSTGISEFETGVQNNKIVLESARVLSRGPDE